MKKPILWKAICDELAGRIKALRAGDDFCTAKEISEEYQVSNITSRRVLNELADMGLIEVIKGRRAIIRKSCESRGELLLVFYDYFMDQENSLSYIQSEMYNGLQTRARELGFTIKVVSQQYLDMIAANPSGHYDIILMDNLPFNELAKAFIMSPSVNAVCCHTVGPAEGVSTVRDDLKAGAKLAMRHLLSKGHRRIAYITGVRYQRWFRTRFEGYYESLAEAGIDFSPSIVKEIDNMPSSQPETERALEELLSVKNPPTAIFAATDMHAIHILSAARRKGLRVPDDLAVLGFDNRPESAIAIPPLTTVDTCWHEQGRLSLDRMKGLIENPEAGHADVIVEPRLIVRESA